MNSSTNNSVIVNNENPQNYLFFNPAKQPTILLPNGAQQIIPKTAFGAWYLRTRFKTLNASDEARDWFLSNNPLNIGDIPYLKTPPKDFQKLAIARMHISNCGLWLDMGLGKTLIYLAFCLQTYVQTGRVIYFVLCPLSVFATWEEQIAKHIEHSLGVNLFFAHGPKRNDICAKLNAYDFKAPVFVVTTYETLESVREKLQNLKTRVGAIYFDEASRVKNIEAARTQAAHAFARNLYEVPRFCASGTPSTASVTGYFSLYELIAPGASTCRTFFNFKKKFEESKKFYVVDVPEFNEETGSTLFVQKHVFADAQLNWLQRNQPPGSPASYFDLGYSLSERPENEHQLRISRVYNKPEGAKNLDQLKIITDTWAYALKKEDVLTDLPPKSFVRREIKMTEEQEKHYSDLLHFSRTEINATKFSFRHLNTPFSKLHQIANGYLMNGDTVEFLKSQPKIDELLHIIEEAGSQKIVVWSPMIHQIKQVSQVMKKKNIRHVVMYGATSKNNRISAVHQFTTDPEVQIMVANPSVAGLGLNLQCAHLEVFLSNWYAPDVRDQAVDRCHRQGQSNAVTIIDLICENSLERKILNSLEASINLENEILSIEDLGGQKYVA